LRREISTEELPDTPVTDVTIDYHFLERQLAQEINQLPEKCRLVFTYSRELGYSNKEIAGELQISEKAVEKHITHARKKLAVNLRSLLHSLFSLW
jgi:RNA polymerase sigma-70 factor (ECF subfamily)